MNNLSLYHLTEELAALLDSEDDVTAQLDALLPTIEHKAAAVAHYQQMEKDRAGMLRKRGEEIMEEARVCESRSERWKGYLKACMEQAEIMKITDTRTGTSIAIEKNGGALPLIIEDEDGLRRRGYTKETPLPLDNDLIRRDLEAGTLFGGARFGERGTHLRIRG